MMISVEISMYPLEGDYKPAIRAFIHDLRAQSGITTVTNQMNTQITGEFDVVVPALNACMKRAMTTDSKIVFVTKFLNTGLDIEHAPDLVD